MTRARRTAVLAGALLLGASWLRGAPQVEADPHEMYEKARDYVADGELRAAATTLSRLRDLIVKRPDWDPEGVFTNNLLPPLQARLARLQSVARRLDDFTVKALQDLQPPDIKKDISTVRDYTDWATSVIQRLRDERDRIIVAELADPEERAFLTHTESYERTDRLLEVDVLKRLADTAGDDILGLIAGDPGLESVLVRFRQLKRDLMQIVAERDRLETEVKKSRERDEALLGTLAGVVTDDASLKGRPPVPRPVNVSDLFARFLDDEQEAMRRRTYATPSELEVLRTNLGRYGRYNDALHAAGLSQDQKEKLGVLSKLVDDLPVQGGVFGSVSATGIVSLLLLGAMVLVAGSLGWLAIARGRRLARLERAGARRAARLAVEVARTDVESNVV